MTPIQLEQQKQKAQALWDANAAYDGRRAQDWQTFDLFLAYYRGNEAGRINISAPVGR